MQSPTYMQVNDRLVIDAHQLQHLGRAFNTTIVQVE